MKPWFHRQLVRTAHEIELLAVQRSGATLANPRGAMKLQDADELSVIGPQQWDPVLI